ncbi:MULTISPECIES: hypothetical protein [Kitasatospora]|uniref:hypothetical protein n=1 Tax=Kitasatospora TaxID=2063 RepID=UPI00117E1BD0|nr:hypothetical protein [Kitasatospora sp. GP30]MDH6139860.1 hypothetical protein [Kitasatospora sp. GP30]
MGKPGHLKRPALVAGPLKVLNDALHELHLKAGKPSLTEMVRLVSVSRSRSGIHGAFSGDTLPRRDTVDALVGLLCQRARGLDVEAELNRFDHLWQAAAQSASNAESAAESGSRQVSESRPRRAPVVPSVREVEILAERLTTLISEHAGLGIDDFANIVQLSDVVTREYVSGDRIPPQSFLDSLLSVLRLTSNLDIWTVQKDLQALRLGAIRAKYSRGDIHSFQQRIAEVDPSSDTRRELEGLIQAIQGPVIPAPPALAVVAVVELSMLSSLARVEQVAAMQALRGIVFQSLIQYRLGSDFELQSRGDGFLVVFSGAVSSRELASSWVNQIWQELENVNVSLSRPISVRAALVEGAVERGDHGAFGSAVVGASRLVNTEPLRDMSAQEGCELAVAVTDDLYQLMSEPGSSEGYIRVGVAAKEWAASVWLRSFERLGPRPGQG